VKPLAGCRVLDLGIITAGAATAAVLADFGAEVIKVESPSYRDPFRRWLSNRPDDAVEDLPPFFRATNRGKAGLSVDLKHPRGREVFLRLVARSDIVVENFRRGVLAKLQLDYATLRATNPTSFWLPSPVRASPVPRHVMFPMARPWRRSADWRGRLATRAAHLPSAVWISTILTRW